MISFTGGGEEERTCNETSICMVNNANKGKSDVGGGAATGGPPGLVATGVGGAPDDSPADRSRQQRGGDKKERR